MPVYELIYTRECSFVVEAESKEEVRNAYIDTTYVIWDEESDVVELRNSTPEYGIYEGEIVLLEDIPQQEKEPKKLTEEEKWAKEYAVGDPRQTRIEVD